MNNLSAQVLAQLSPLFDDIIHIEPITSGLSQYCFDVIVSKDNQQQHVIAKLYRQHSAKTTIECDILKQLKDTDFTPTLVATTENILLLEKLAGQTLTNNVFSLNEKITHSLNMMVKCHSINLSEQQLSPLNFDEIFKYLFEATELTSAKKTSYQQLINDSLIVLNQIESSDIYLNNTVFCHGDLNFSNVLVNNNKAYLIDFESACLMPPEYDIAMMMAVNELPFCELANIIAKYQSLKISKQPESFKINTGMVTRYYCLSLLINGLWYLSRITSVTKNDNGNLYLLKANQQFSLLNSL